MKAVDLLPARWIEACILLGVSLFVLCFIVGCAAPVAVPTAQIPVAVPVDCKYPDPGPKPDLSALSALTTDSTPQDVLTVMGQALAALAEDDARLRALMNHGQ